MDANQLISALLELSDVERTLEVVTDRGDPVNWVDLRVRRDGAGRQIVLAPGR